MPALLVVVVNDDGKGGRAYNECRYENNYFEMKNVPCKREG